jgi:hypothetical protein
VHSGHCMVKMPQRNAKNFQPLPTRITFPFFIIFRFTFPECEAETYSASWDLYGFFKGPVQMVDILADNIDAMYPISAQLVQLDVGTVVELQCLNLVQLPPTYLPPPSPPPRIRVCPSFMCEMWLLQDVILPISLQHI